MTDSPGLKPFNLFRRNKKPGDRRKKVADTSFYNVSAYWVSLNDKITHDILQSKISSLLSYRK